MALPLATTLGHVRDADLGARSAAVSRLQATAGNRAVQRLVEVQREPTRARSAKKKVVPLKMLVGNKTMRLTSVDWGAVPGAMTGAGGGRSRTPAKGSNRETGGGDGGEVTVTKPANDADSAALARASGEGKNLGEVTIVYTHESGAVYLRVTLADVFVSGHSVSGAEHGGDAFTLTATSVTTEYIPLPRPGDP